MGMGVVNGGVEPFRGEGTSPAERRIIGVLCAAYAAATLMILPFAADPGPVVPAVTTTFGTGVLIADLCTGYLLLVQFRAVPSLPMLLLAVAYFYSAAMALLHVLAFPGAWIPDAPLIGNPQSVGWLFIVWIVGFPVLVLAAVVAEASPLRVEFARRHVGRATTGAVIGTLMVVAAITLATTAEQAWLPQQLQGNVFAAWGNAAQWMAVALSLAAFVAVVVITRWRSLLYCWLGVAMIAFMAFNALAVSGGARYTVGWDLSRVSGLVSSSLLLVFFLGQFARLQRSLAGALLRLRTANETLEQRIVERTEELQASNRNLQKALAERNVLLREVYHRVKNNLQVIDSIIAIQAAGLGATPPEEVLNDLRNRVHTLGLVHQQLMASDDLETFDVAPFLTELGANLSFSTAGERTGIAIAVESDRLIVGLDFAIPLGLLVTELVSNAVKHAFSDESGRAVRVRLERRPDDALLLSVADNGRGHTGGQGTMPGGGGFGLGIVEALVIQLDGKMDTSSAGGTLVRICIPFSKAEP